MQMVVFGDANSKRAFPRSPGWRWRPGFGGALIAAGSFRPMETCGTFCGTLPNPACWAWTWKGFGPWPWKSAEL